MDSVAQQVNLDHRDLLDQMGLGELMVDLVREVRKDLEDHLGNKERGVNQAKEAHRDHVDQLVQLGLLENQVKLVNVGLLDRQVQLYNIHVHVYTAIITYDYCIYFL